MLQLIKQIMLLGGVLTIFPFSVADAVDSTAKWRTFVKPSKEELKKHLRGGKQLEVKGHAAGHTHRQWFSADTL
jgi:hypothetical protein